MSRIQRLTNSAATALLVAVFACGPAAAQSQDMRTPDARDAATPTRVTSSPAEPALQDVRSPDARDAAEVATPVVVQVQPDADSGMSWDSAAIGALIAAGLLVAIAGAVALVSRRRAPGRARPAV